MAFFDKLGEFAKTVGDKTGGAIETEKLKAKIKAEHSGIAALEARIGAMVYQKYQDGASFDDDICAACVEISSHRDKIAEFEAEIQAIKDDLAAAAAIKGPLCPACGTPNPEGTKFCSACGTKIEPPAPPAPAGISCASCGKALEPGAKFCPYCGAKTESPAPVPVEKTEQVCAGCGATLAEGAKFCTICGTKTS